MELLKKILGIVCSIARIVYGLMWMQSGYEKLTGGFTVKSLVPVIAMNTDTPQWYKTFFAATVGPFSGLFDIIIPWGELFIGIGLVTGILVLPALVMAIFVNVNYILADMIFTYPTQIMVATILIIGGKATSYVSVERYFLAKQKQKAASA